jgi:hypothetical protein
MSFRDGRRADIEIQDTEDHVFVLSVGRMADDREEEIRRENLEEEHPSRTSADVTVGQRKGGTEAAVTFFDPRADWSAAISTNLNDTYSGRRAGPKDEARAAPVRPGRSRGRDARKSDVRIWSRGVCNWRGKQE